MVAVWVLTKVATRTSDPTGDIEPTKLLMFIFEKEPVGVIVAVKARTITLKKAKEPVGVMKPAK